MFIAHVSCEKNERDNDITIIIADKSLLPKSQILLPTDDVMPVHIHTAVKPVSIINCRSN